ncbi:hypothetical protein [Luteimonas suaedae]|uniref:hypothetical protein n=1 Tax=Luteimonas suaedae TaxID=2605430 RepID=UPI0011ECB7FB|nr:hypothetical protein [Luteimonas suaedae]
MNPKLAGRMQSFSIALLLLTSRQLSCAEPHDTRGSAGAETQSYESINGRIFGFIESLEESSNINRKTFEAQMELQPSGTSAFNGSKFVRYIYGMESDWGYLFTVKDAVLGSVDIGIARTMEYYRVPIESCALNFDVLALRLRALNYDGTDATVHALGGERMVYEKGNVRIRVTYTTTRAMDLSCVNVIEIESAEAGNG